MLVACLTSLVAINGKNHVGTGIPQLLPLRSALERAQNDAFGPPSVAAGFTVCAECAGPGAPGRRGSGDAPRVVVLRECYTLRTPARRGRRHAKSVGFVLTMTCFVEFVLNSRAR